jgi:hypothetical protein
MSKRQKTARAKLDKLFDAAAHTLVVHYSCESFYDRPNGASPRITSIAVRNLDTGQTTSFSIHQVGERHGQAADAIDANYDSLEKEMLGGFFAFVERHPNHNWMHWNMRDTTFGFAAVEHRFRVRGGNPIVIPDDNKFDLSRLLVDIYGVGYIGHPRLDNLVTKNNITRLGFLTGAEEAAAFESHNYVGLHQSTLRKVDVLANIAGRAQDRTLKTNATWWERNGSSFRGVADTVASHPLYVLLAVVAGIASIVGLLALFR